MWLRCNVQVVSWALFKLLRRHQIRSPRDPHFSCRASSLVLKGLIEIARNLKVLINNSSIDSLTKLRLHIRQMPTARSTLKTIRGLRKGHLQISRLLPDPDPRSPAWSVLWSSRVKPAAAVSERQAFVWNRLKFIRSILPH